VALEVVHVDLDSECSLVRSGWHSAAARAADDLVPTTWNNLSLYVKAT